MRSNAHTSDYRLYRLNYITPEVLDLHLASAPAKARSQLKLEASNLDILNRTAICNFRHEAGLDFSQNTILIAADPRDTSPIACREL